MEGKRDPAGSQRSQDGLLLTAFCLGLGKAAKSTQPTQQKQDEPHGLASWTPAPGNGSWPSIGQLGARGEGGLWAAHLCARRLLCCSKASGV